MSAQIMSPVVREHRFASATRENVMDAPAIVSPELAAIERSPRFKKLRNWFSWRDAFTPDSAW